MPHATDRPTPIILDISGPHADTGHSRAAVILAERLAPDDTPPEVLDNRPLDAATVTAWWAAREARDLVRHVRMVAAVAWVGCLITATGPGATPRVAFALGCLAVALHTPVRPAPRRSRMHSVWASNGRVAVDALYLAGVVAAIAAVVPAGWERSALVAATLYPWRYLTEQLREVVGRALTARDPHAVPEWAVHGIARYHLRAPGTPSDPPPAPTVDA